MEVAAKPLLYISMYHAAESLYLVGGSFALIRLMTGSIIVRIFLDTIVYFINTMMFNLLTKITRSKNRNFSLYFIHAATKPF
jgi:hypothetical protein